MILDANSPGIVLEVRGVRNVANIIDEKFRFDVAGEEVMRAEVRPKQSGILANVMKIERVIGNVVNDYVNVIVFP